MRLWSLHPKYLDSRGLVAVWREGLLARKVLQGGTRGYLHHPQLQRFQSQMDPVAAVDAYLEGILEEASGRGYRFDGSKIRLGLHPGHIEVTDGQLRYEWKHLLLKLAQRDPPRYERLENLSIPDPHPLFIVVNGEIAAWERTTPGHDHD
jgi:hypothetical protein